MAYEPISLNTEVATRLRRLRAHWGLMLYSNELSLSLGATIGLLMDVIEEHSKTTVVDGGYLRDFAKKYPRRGRPKKRNGVASPDDIGNVAE